MISLFSQMKTKTKHPSIWSYRTDCCLSWEVEIEQTWMNIVQKSTNFSYKMNKSWGYNVQHGTIINVIVPYILM